MEQNKVPLFDRMQVYNSLNYTLACCKQSQTLQLYSCPLPGECVYSSLLSPFCEAEIQLLKCVACHTSRLRHCILAERSVGHTTPCHFFSLLVHKLPLSDHWPRRHVWFIDSKGENNSGWASICFRSMIIMGTLRKEGGWWGLWVPKPLFIKWTCEHHLEEHKSTSVVYLMIEFLWVVLWLRNNTHYVPSKSESKVNYGHA